MTKFKKGDRVRYIGPTKKLIGLIFTVQASYPYNTEAFHPSVNAMIIDNDRLTLETSVVKPKFKIGDRVRTNCRVRSIDGVTVTPDAMYIVKNIDATHNYIEILGSSDCFLATMFELVTVTSSIDQAIKAVDDNIIWKAAGIEPRKGYQASSEPSIDPMYCSCNNPQAKEVSYGFGYSEGHSDNLYNICTACNKEIK